MKGGQVALPDLDFSNVASRNENSGQKCFCFDGESPYYCYRGMGQAWTARDVLTFRQHVNGVLGIKNTGFRKHRLTVFLWTDENGGFRIRRCHTKSPSPDHTSYSAFHACKECYHDSNALRVGAYFFFFDNGAKNFRFKNYPDTCSRLVRFVRSLHLKK